MKATAYQILGICLFACFLSACSDADTGVQVPVETAILDLSAHDFSERFAVSLSGNWEFYKDELLSPTQIASGSFSPEYVGMPYSWKNTPIHGYATYHTLIKLPKDAPALALNLPFIPTACSVFIDYELVHQNGIVATSEAETKMNLSPIYTTIPSVKDSFMLTLQVSNYEFNTGGISHEIFIGSAEEIMMERNLEILFSLLLSGGLAFIGIFFLLGGILGNLEKGFLYIGISFLAFSYWKSSAWSKIYNHFLPNFDWEWSMRLEFFTVFVITFGVISFSNALYPSENEQRFVRFIQGLEIVLGLSMLLIPITVCFTIIDYHLYALGFVFLYLSIVIIRAITHRRKDVMFAAWGVLFGLIHFGLHIASEPNINLSNTFLDVFANVFMFALLVAIVVYRERNKQEDLSQQAMAGAQAKTQFLSVISHEMRTPMNGILGMTQLLNTTVLSKEQNSYVQSIQTSGESLITLIDDILDLTRIKEGKLKIESKTFDVHALAHETFKLFKQQIEDKGLQLHLNISPDVPQYIKSSPIRLKQVIDNLVNNAIKFTEQGYIRIHLDIKKKANHTLLHCNVEDTGVGIPFDKQLDIFRQFSQVDSTISRKHNGVGLGLSICRRLVIAMGGEIEVQSTPGKGSTFSFYIKVKAGDLAVSAISDNFLSTTRASEDLQILIAEDNAVNMKLMQMGLKKLGYETDAVVNGREAWQASMRKNYDLILMDIQMPEMDGLKATRLILQEAHTGYYPYIVALTANAFPEDKQKAYAAGINDYLVKPVKLARIKELLGQVTERRQRHLKAQESF